jgi:arylsulfatase A-like enzyme
MARADADDREPTAVEMHPWPALRRGEADYETVWEHYLDNLRYALDEVRVLLENLDAETVVITADHGEAFGDFGAHGHPDGLLLPQIKRVPWFETTAVDRGWRQPTLDRSDAPETEVEEHLADLGYM